MIVQTMIRQTIAKEFGVTLVAGQPRPQGWNGKQWACHQGSQVAKGRFFVFTDADTFHCFDGLKAIVTDAINNEADMMTALPFHKGIRLWERILGPFQVLLLAVTAPYGNPKPGRVFAIGQYLLFRKRFYDRIGGHEAVKDSFVEDIPLANLALKKLGRYRVWHGKPIFQVRMYETLSDFIAGWRRNFRAGLKDSSKTAPLEILAYFCAITGAGQFMGSSMAALVALATWGLVYVAQRNLGNFSWVGILLAPVSLVLFTLITILAVWDDVLGRELKWKGRGFQTPS